MKTTLQLMALAALLCSSAVEAEAAGAGTMPTKPTRGICPGCGKRVSRDTIHCPRCGKRCRQ